MAHNGVTHWPSLKPETRGVADALVPALEHGIAESLQVVSNVQSPLGAPLAPAVAAYSEIRELRDAILEKASAQVRGKPRFGLSPRPLSLCLCPIRGLSDPPMG